MITITLISFAALVSFAAGYYAAKRHTRIQAAESWRNGFSSGREDVKSDIPDHIRMHRRTWARSLQSMN